MKTTFILITLAVMSADAFAGKCVLTIDREPCAGKTDEARKPYDGKNPTEEEKKVASTEDKCIAEAKKNCIIVRQGTLAKKSIKAKFDDKVVGGDNACADVKEAVGTCK